MTLISSRRSMRWVFTINNPDHETYPSDDPNQWGYRYVVWQLEKGDSGTEHLQGYVVWHNAKSLAQCKLQNPRAHWEIMRGTLEQNDKYCKKSEGQLAGPWIRGRRPQPGKRSDLSLVADAIMRGERMRPISFAYPNCYMKYFKGMYELQMQVRGKERTAPKIYVFHGPSGIGKSKLVSEVYPEAYWKPKGKWWDGYDGEDVVVIDEYYGWMSLDLLLRLLDRYPLMVERKGGTLPMLAQVFVFTSNVEPRDWYRNLPVQRTDALLRRLKEYGEVYTKDALAEEFVQDLTYN